MPAAAPQPLPVAEESAMPFTFAFTPPDPLAQIEERISHLEESIQERLRSIATRELEQRRHAYCYWVLRRFFNASEKARNLSADYHWLIEEYLHSRPVSEQAVVGAQLALINGIAFDTFTCNNLNAVCSARSNTTSRQVARNLTEVRARYFVTLRHAKFQRNMLRQHQESLSKQRQQYALFKTKPAESSILVDSADLVKMLSRDNNVTHAAVGIKNLDYYDSNTDEDERDDLLMVQLSIEGVTTQCFNAGDSFSIQLPRLRMILGFAPSSFQPVITQLYSERAVDGYEDKMGHPHWLTPTPCLGDFGSSIALAAENQDLLSVICVYIEFLRHAYVPDNAGRYAYRFDINADADEDSGIPTCGDPDCESSECQSSGWSVNDTLTLAPALDPTQCTHYYSS